MADSQDIEAKLAAYVDGELPADQRAEIEKYLSANPQQRRLIADLMRQRDVLRDLPKAAAPADVSETINAQLERSVLLDGPEAGGVAGTIRPWRSVAAVAAVILLVGALGLAIYSLLPSPTRKPPDLASIQTVPASRPSAEEALSAGSGAAGPVPSEQELRARSAFARSEVRENALVPPPSDQTAAAGGLAAPAPMTMQVAPSVAENSPATEPAIVPPLAQPTLTAASRTETITIATADAAATRRQLASTLTALGGKIEPPTTAPADVLESADHPLVVAVTAQDMDKALAIAQSFQTPSPATPLGKSVAMDSATQPAMDMNSNAGNSQMQAIAPAPQPIEPQMQATPATLPSQTVTVRIAVLAPELPPTTVPTTNPATDPTSNPATEPTTRP